MKIVYICSPYTGNIEKNIQFAKASCHYAMEQGYAPVAVHLFYPQFLDDDVPSERETGIQMGLRVLVACEELWICGERISSGMSCEIDEAKWLGIPIRKLSSTHIQGGHNMKQYGILARRSAASVCGSAEAWLKRDGEPVTFDSYEEADAEASRLMNKTGTINVSYYPKEREIELEEAPASGMVMKL